MPTTTRRVRGNRYTTYYLGRPRSVYARRFDTTSADGPATATAEPCA